MQHFTSKDIAVKKSIPEKVDTLIVGAGMSGLYSAWQINRNFPEHKVIVFEKSWRTGGRLDSDLIKFNYNETVREEEGGMRFTFDLMENLMALLLILELDSDIVPFPMKTNGNNRLYFRGKSFNNTISAADNFAIWSELYNLSPDEQNVNPNSIIDTVFNRILATNPQFTDRPAPNNRTPEFWQAFRLECKWKGVPLVDWTLWNLFTDMGYSRECITMLYGLSGFNGTFLSTMNAGEAYQLLEDFPANPDFKTLRNGFSTLPNALVKAIGKDKIYLDTQVTSIDERTPDGYYTVSYTSKDKDGNFNKRKIFAKKIILCIPRLPLEQLFTKSNALNILPDSMAEKLWNNLQTTTNQPLLKINLYFEKAWWATNLTGQPSVEYGPNFSDLPTGSVYPFYAIDEATIAALEYEKYMQTVGKPIPKKLQSKLDAIRLTKFDRPAALTIYCDFMNINFWKALQRNGPLFTSTKQEDLNKQTPQVVFPASQAVVDAAITFFKQIFNTNFVPQPILTSARIWEGSSLYNLPPSEQFDYGVHQWGIQANDKEVIEYLTQPLENIYTCGEAYSDYQGWVEGALRSANLVLAKEGFELESIAKEYKDKHHVSPMQAVSESYSKKSTEMIQKHIDPDFKPERKKILVQAQGKVTDPLLGIKLTYFDSPEGQL
ncbi:FAD-dependent oxidoreductase [Spirosoma fluviale]|uniref:Flavin containing amine oxidoreductase n=1 Tax=Spirosoma fluviale TaxID=1597977 RepID=A0A286G2D4_9BACT|nr:FAD-dependent oxidoreductase [Spirosoma fluviale]SOD89707.1 Flavin containing amine oxidoreductase [Spirosoma fluviale]